MRSRNWWGAGLFIGLCLALPRPAAGQSYAYTKVLDYLTPRPDGAGQFTINSVTTPAFDGQWVVFRDNGPADDVSRSSIWSFNTLDGTFHKLVSLTTPVPGGAGNFSSVQLLDTAPFVRQGTVILVGRDSSVRQFDQGLYSMPAARRNHRQDRGLPDGRPEWRPVHRVRCGRQASRRLLLRRHNRRVLRAGERRNAGRLHGVA